MSAQSQYRSYLLRIWRQKTNGGATWRVVLQDVVSQHQLTFTSLSEATTFLEQQLEFDLADPQSDSPGHKQSPPPNQG